MAANLDAAASAENPVKALEQQSGKYQDPVEKLSFEERFGTNVNPQVKGPNPFRGLR
jgi:hypothetical protein